MGLYYRYFKTPKISHWNFLEIQPEKGFKYRVE
jgi:hypothetical protein